MIVAEPLEELVTEAVLLRLDSPEFAQAWDAHAEDAEVAGPAGELEADQVLLDELATAYGQRQITLRELLKARAPIEARIEQARKQLSRAGGKVSLREFAGHSARLRDAWDGMAVSRRQAVIAAVLERVTIGPGVRGRARFDPDRVTPTWKL